MNLIREYPELQQSIDDEATKFLKDFSYRHKRQVGDLGEFMVKLSLSKYGIMNKEMNTALLQEFLTR